MKSTKARTLGRKVTARGPQGAKSTGMFGKGGKHLDEYPILELFAHRKVR